MAATTESVRMDDGANIYVKSFGDRSNTLIIALHGAPGLSTHAEPASNLSFLAERFHFVVYDGRGSGQSDLKLPYTHQRWLADLDAIRQRFGAEKFILMGGSYGGFLSLDYALHYPERLHALILRDTWADVDPQRQLRMWSGNLIDDDDFVKGIGEMTPLFLAPATSHQQTEYPVAQKTVAHAATQNAAFGQNMRTFDVRSKLHSITAPTLVIVGRHDLITPVYFSQEIADGIPGSTLHIFEKSGHNPPQEEAEACQEVIWKFLDSVKV